MRAIEVARLAESVDQVAEYWSPRVVGELNDQQVMVAKVRGAFVWHAHAREDELFLVLKGRLMIKLRDGDVEVGAGEFVIVPRGVEHKPVAEEEAHILLFEPRSTQKRGD